MDLTGLQYPFDFSRCESGSYGWTNIFPRLIFHRWQHVTEYFHFWELDFLKHVDYDNDNKFRRKESIDDHYPPVDEMVEIFDEHWSDQLGVVDIQCRFSSLEGAIYFTILLNHFPVVFGYVLKLKRRIIVVNATKEEQNCFSCVSISPIATFPMPCQPME